MKDGAGTVTSIAEVQRPAWRASTALQLAVAVGLVIATVGTLASRVDMVLLALPLLLSAAISLDQRPAEDSSSRLQIDVAQRAHADGTSEFAYDVALEAPPGTAFVHLRLVPQGAPVFDLILAADHIDRVAGGLPVVHSGRQRVVDMSYRLIGVNGAWISAPSPIVVAERVVDPALAPIASIPLPHRLSGLTGTHASARPGDGGEFRDLHPYAPGDRLRRIDWKSTARRSQGLGDLYVRRTDATADATLVLVIDGRDEIGERVEQWSADADGAVGLTSLDVAREAAASLAAAAIGGGDRVGLFDLAVHDGLVPAGCGKRHLDRLRRRIAVVGPSSIRLSRRRAPIVPAGSIVYLLSTFLDDEGTSMALLWRASGHRVIAVDILPAPMMEGSAPATRVAHRLLMAERRQRIALLQSNGIELLRWQEDASQPSRAVMLRTLARAGRRRA